MHSRQSDLHHGLLELFKSSSQLTVTVFNQPFSSGVATLSIFVSVVMHYFNVCE